MVKGGKKGEDNCQNESGALSSEERKSTVKLETSAPLLGTRVQILN
jgi:hypothetical protein